MSFVIAEKNIKSKIKVGETVAVVENIKYPHFSCEKEEKYKRLCDRMNSFYTSVAEKYSFHARNKLTKRIKLSRLTCKLPLVLAMNYTIAICDEKLVSVVLDLTFTEGKNIKMRRFSQMWSVKDENILPVNEIIKNDRVNRKKIYSFVLKAAKENGENPAFGYFGDYILKLSRHFDIKKCFAVPNGLCFFVNAGILSPVKYGANNFILPFDRLRDMLNWDFLTKLDEKEGQNENIVNNV